MSPEQLQAFIAKIEKLRTESKNRMQIETSSISQAHHQGFNNALTTVLGLIEKLKIEGVGRVEGDN